MKNLNCYIHIPFCTSKCKYCRFASFSWLSQLKVNNYVDFLCKEIRDFSYLEPITLDTIYFWWWTPSTLNLKQFEKIFFTLKQKFTFSEKIEINIESTPEMINLENLNWWEKLWFNRISIWIQSLNPKTLEEIARSEKWDILKCFETLKIFFKKPKHISLSIDFIIWLPFVKKWWVKKDIKYLLEKYDFVTHISVYMLEEYYDIPEEIDSKFENIVYPNSWRANSIDEADYSEEYLQIKNFLKEKWFERYEISNFSKPWFECTHNKWYWNHKENLAFWLGSHGFFENIRFSKSESFLDYYSKKNISKEKIWKEEKFLEKIMFWLRTSGIEKKYLKNLNFEKINYFCENWYLQYKDDKLALTDKSVLFLDYILKEIF